MLTSFSFIIAPKPDIRLSGFGVPDVVSVRVRQDVDAATAGMHECSLLPELREGVLDPAASSSSISDGMVTIPTITCFGFRDHSRFG